MTNRRNRNRKSQSQSQSPPQQRQQPEERNRDEQIPLPPRARSRIQEDFVAECFNIMAIIATISSLIYKIPGCCWAAVISSTISFFTTHREDRMLQYGATFLFAIMCFFSYYAQHELALGLYQRYMR